MTVDVIHDDDFDDDDDIVIIIGVFIYSIMSFILWILQLIIPIYHIQHRFSFNEQRNPKFTPGMIYIYSKIIIIILTYDHHYHHHHHPNI